MNNFTEVFSKLNTISKLEGGQFYDHRYYRPLTETTIKRVAEGHDDQGYAIVSACRGENRQKNFDMDDELLGNSNEINDIRTEQIRELIYDYGYTYIPVFGRYEEKTKDGRKIASLEKSFIIYPYKRNNELVPWNKFVKDVYEIANSQDDNGDYIFNQDSILFKEPDKSPTYMNPRTQTIAFKPGDNIVYNDTDQTYFTALKKWKDIAMNDDKKSWDVGKPQRFTFKEAFLYQYPGTSNGCQYKKNQGELF